MYQDFVIKAFQACLPLFDQLRLERSLPVTRHLDVHMSLLAFQGFLAMPIAAVACSIALASMLCVHTQTRCMNRLSERTLPFVRTFAILAISPNAKRRTNKLDAESRRDDTICS